MKKRKNAFEKLMSLITYKEKKKVREFVIPEVNEKDEKTAENNCSGPDSDVNMNRFDDENYVKLSDGDKIPDGIEKNVQLMEKILYCPKNKGINIKRIRIGDKYNGIMVYLRGMVDNTMIDTFIMRPLLSYRIDDKKNCHIHNNGSDNEIDFIFDQVIQTSRNKKCNNVKNIVDEILEGNTALYIDGASNYLICYTKGFEKRNVDKPQIEGAVKASQEAFNEDLDTNITLIRRIIKNRNLISEKLRIGKNNNIDCAVMYMEGIVNPAIVDEVKRRINSIDTDAILGSGMLEQYIEDNSWSIVPTVLSTERPDRTAHYIMEGKVAIISFATPFAIIVPSTFSLMFHTAEDDFLKWQYTLFLRIIRIMGMFVAVMFPGLYISIVNFHQEMIPTSILIAIATAREDVPFPTILEIFFMEAAFGLITEAGVRIPGIIGNTIGIVGALILGQAAVEASIISPVLIIVVAFTILGNYSIPDFSLSYGVRIFRVIFIVLGAMLGFLGISIGIVVTATMLVSLKSFGVPFLSIMAPKTRKASDTVLSKPLWRQEMRPDPINPLNLRKQPKISKKWTKEDADYNEDKL
ncbi:MAG: spore germination protein [Clostridium sp.]|jgi:spore germination protein KA|uniref:spore germination protein n=1 Tax=Clostridium sp. TaxID=1506 RepID=UPI0025BFD62F|nr:spore germination protein [Clostridium sp.]MCH3965935.1 spore germination protein [Clostridium sp.]MCI1715976.1 spore germination protein [Clostridium sp.]MCI1800352.1 spore germination protein [Clostridium sp.]MCI1814153.1 spore germination protein [Clostridium sp.]MCI1871052.1 spore germination protein [Clostridium sp.]